MNTDRVRVRFAPSPTGYLHIGGARTALFNYLYAKNLGGDFLLRIEDTDLERSSEEMITKILDGLSWLGLTPDEEPVLQSRYKQEHVDAAARMLESGHAYRCFCSKEELDQERKDAEAQGKIYTYSKRCRALSDSEVTERLNAGRPYTVRLKVPDGGVTRFRDMVYKSIEVQNREIDDFILLRSDGNPVYHLAVVVDDARMGITHVIRGEDHLSNTPKQILIYLALGLSVPRFAHVPLILGSDGKRLSKRFGATSVEEFQAMGFLPQGVVNSLALLGWSHPSNGTVFDLHTLVKDFDMARINRKGAIFDLDKMIYINGQHVSSASAETLFEDVTGAWEKAGYVQSDEISHGRERLLSAIDLMKQRMRLTEEFVRFGAYLFRDPETYDPEAVEKYWAAERLDAMMATVAERFAAVSPFRAADLEASLRHTAEEFDVKAAVLIHALRLAVTGFSVSPDIFQLLEFLGSEVIQGRLKKAAQFITERMR